MRNLMDEALLKLYWACRTNSGFPGELPDESNGPITTEVILKALGLVGPDFDEQVSFLAEAKDQDSHLGNPQRAETQARNRMPLQPATPSESDGSSAEGSHSVAARQTPTTSPHSPLFHSRSNTFSNPLSTTTTMTTPMTTPMPTNMPMPTPTPTKATFQELPALVSAQSTAHIPQPAMKVQSGVGIANGENDVESYLDVDAFLDTSVSPEHINTSGSFDQGMQPFNGLSLDQTGHFSPPQQGYFMSAPPIRDDYLYPWPGSLAAAYQAVPNV